MKQDYHQVLIERETYKNLRRFLIEKNKDIIKGDICNAATEAIEQYIAREKSEGEEL